MARQSVDPVGGTLVILGPTVSGAAVVDNVANLANIAKNHIVAVSGWWRPVPKARDRG